MKLDFTLFTTLCLLAFFSGSTIMPPHAASGREEPDHDPIEAIYAPFDSLLTDVHDYIWPTSASMIVTSSFADFRRTHFHGGIDISTNNRKGYPVFASRSGYVSRIRVSPYGYGKMLYVRHADGYSTTYAHLQKFHGEIERYVTTLQKTNRRYALDLEPDSLAFRVSKGDVIAYTGDTGIGSPHLHFEVRDEAMNPVNPFLLPAIGSAHQDAVPPTFHAAAFTPLDHRSLVQSSPRQRIVQAERTGRGTYRLQQVVSLSGTIGLGVRISDRTDHGRYVTGVHRLELYVDGDLWFSSTKNRVPASESRQVAMYHDARLLRLGTGRFEKLFVEPGNRLPFFNRLPDGSGVLNTAGFEEGFHELAVHAWDIAGNRSTLTARALFNHVPEFFLEQLGDRIILIPAERSEIDAVSIWTKTRERWTARRVRAQELTPLDGGFALPLGREITSVTRITAENRFGTQSHPEYVFPRSGHGEASPLFIEKEFIGDILYLTIRSESPITRKPIVRLKRDGGVVMVTASAVSPNEHLGVIPLSETASGSNKLYIAAEVNGHPVEAIDSFTVAHITPDLGGTLRSEDGEFTLRFPPGGVYQTIYARIERTSDGYALLPLETVLARTATAELRIPASIRRERVGLFFSDGGGYELLAPAAPDAETVSGRMSRFAGEFALMKDENPPSISGLRVRYSRGTLSITFRLHDNLAGVDAEKLSVTIGNEFLIAEYDPYRRRVTYEGVHQLPRGEHIVSIEAADRMGNTSSARHSLRVPPR